ncbi:MAG: translation initiation factor IF-2, partial [Candidatus Neomarinimicrobiota bacterium]
TRQMVLSEFAKDKEIVDRYRKEQVRKEIHDTRLRESQVTSKKLELLTLKDQRILEKKEKEVQEIAQKEKAKKLRREAQEKKKAESEAKIRKLAAEKEKTKKVPGVEKDKPAVKAETKTKAIERKEKQSKKSIRVAGKKRKLRKIDLSDIESKLGQGTRKQKAGKPDSKTAEVPQSAKDRVKRTLAKIDTKGKKKIYRKDRAGQGKDDAVDSDSNIVKISEYASVDELSKLLNVSSSEIIKTCFGLGIMATINQRLEWDVIELIAEEYGVEAKQVTELGEDLYSLEDTEEDLKNTESRFPVVTVMGHVDHGKTSLLDYIRATSVVAGESGGITQHIGAYKVVVEPDKSITFLDTPGHEAFTAMRARGAQVTDIVVLVVAADDSVMPQTIEAIDHAKAANVPIVVAINKMDKPGADEERVKRELSDRDVLVEDWGGKVQCVPTSAKTGDGVQDLLNMIVLEAEILELKANKNTLAKGTIIDSRLDKGYGPIATLLVQKGTLKVGDPFICNDFSGKVRAIMNDLGERIQAAYPSDAVQVLGFEQVPKVADIFAVVEDERDIKRISSDRQRLRREIDHKRIATRTLDSMSAMIKEGAIKTLPILIKGDVDGSIEALSESLLKLNTEEVGITIIRKSVGMVSESDVLLADASKAVIVGFNVQISSNAKLQAKQAGVEIRNYKIIYNAVEDIKMALEGLLDPEEKEEIIGRAVVQEQFKIPKIGFIAGSKVEEGLIIRNRMARLIRDEEVIGENLEISSLKRFKDDVKEVKEGLECGIGLEGIKKYNEGDIIVVYEIKKIKRKLTVS